MKKKGFKLLGIVVALLFVAGCGIGGGKSETLSCTSTNEISGIKIDAKADMTFENKIINNLVMTMEISATSNLMKNSWSTIEKTYNEQYAAVDKDGLKVTTKSDASNYKYTITIEADPAKATASDLSKYGMDSLAGAKETLDEVKSGLEDAGFTCK